MLVRDEDNADDNDNENGSDNISPDVFQGVDQVRRLGRQLAKHLLPPGEGNVVVSAIIEFLKGDNDDNDDNYEHHDVDHQHDVHCVNHDDYEHKGDFHL